MNKAKSLNLYASSPLSFSKNGKVYSHLCFLLAFFIILIVGGMAIWISIRTLYQHKPLIIQYELPPQEYNPKIPFSTDDFKFGLSLLDRYEEAFISYTWSYWGSGVGTIPMNINKECKFNLIPDENFRCFNQDEATKGKTYLDAKGNWQFFINYHSCYYENPSGDGCGNQNDIEPYLRNNVQATMVYEDLIIDPENYENPIKTIETDVSAMLLVDVGTTLVVELNEIEFISDNGWIFEDLKTVKKLKATTSVKITGQQMLGIQLLYGGKKTVYKRTFPKIQDCLAQISGFIAIIIPMLLILLSSSDNRHTIQNMVNEIYEIKLKKPANDPVPKKISRPSKSKNSSRTIKGTEYPLISQETPLKLKKKTRTPHTALVIGGFDDSEKLPTKEDASQIPEENIEPFRFDSLDKSPSSPLKSSIISPRHDESKFTAALTASLGYEPPKPENERLNENLEEAKEQVENESFNEDEEESKGEEEEVPLRTSDSLEVSWKDWVKSFWKPTPEVQMINKAKEHIMETFDLITLSKKVSEIDKLKACLLTNEQRVIFEHLPSSVIALNPDIDINKPEAIKQYHWNNSCKGDKEALRKAYSKLKEERNELDTLLLKYYENEYICDGLSS